MYHYLRRHGGTIFYNAEDKVLSGQILASDITEAYYPGGLQLFKDSMTLSFSTRNSARYNTQLYGAYNASNIAAALKLADYFGIEESVACRAIADYIPEMNRSQVLRKGSVTFIMDAYNANPSSMVSSISALISVENERKALILGDMKELGHDAVNFHSQILDLIALHQWVFVGLVGENFAEADREQRYQHFKDVDELLSHPPLALLLENSLCLIKGSRSMQLEKVVALV
jgi:UDP-N-acetylmuramoyl-tripeptide--D-alanyl-D-alanine ligase